MKRLLVISLLILMMTPIAAAEQIGNVTLPDSLTAGEKALILNGAGFRKKLFIKVYAGGLYLKQKHTDAQKVVSLDEAEVPLAACGASIELWVVIQDVVNHRFLAGDDRRVERDEYLAVGG